MVTTNDPAPTYLVFKLAQSALIITMLYYQSQESSFYSNAVPVLSALILATSCSETLTPQSPRFGLFNLVIYMVFIMALSQLSSLNNLFALRESSTIASQSSVNKLASTIFEDTTTKIGYAILYQNCQSQDNTPKNVLLRYNVGLDKILNPKLSKDDCQVSFSDTEDCEKADLTHDFQQDKEAMTSQLLEQLKPVGTENLDVNLGSLLTDLGQNGIDNSDCAKTKKVVVNGYFIRHNDESSCRGRTSGILKQKRSMKKTQIFCVSVTILSSTNRLYLIKVMNEPQDSELLAQELEKQEINIIDNLEIDLEKTEKNFVRNKFIELEDQDTVLKRITAKRERLSRKLTQERNSIPDSKDFIKQDWSSSLERSEKEPSNPCNGVELDLQEQSRASIATLPEIELRPSFHLLSEAPKAMNIRRPSLRSSNRRLIHENDDADRSQFTIDTIIPDRKSLPITIHLKSSPKRNASSNSQIISDNSRQNLTEVYKVGESDLTAKNISGEQKNVTIDQLEYDTIEIELLQKDKSLPHNLGEMKKREIASRASQLVEHETPEFFSSSKSSTVKRMNSSILPRTLTIKGSLDRKKKIKTSRKKSNKSIKSVDIFKGSSIPFMFSSQRHVGRKKSKSRSIHSMLSDAASMVTPEYDMVMLQKHSSDLNEQSLARSNPSITKTNLQNERTFVYKIIHDLRHPTEALTYAIQTLLDQTRNKKVSQKRSSSLVVQADQKSQMQSQPVFQNHKIERSVKRLQLQVFKNQHLQFSPQKNKVLQRQLSQPLLRFGKKPPASKLSLKKFSSKIKMSFQAAANDNGQQKSQSVVQNSEGIEHQIKPKRRSSSLIPVAKIAVDNELDKGELREARLASIEIKPLKANLIEEKEPSQLSRSSDSDSISLNNNDTEENNNISFMSNSPVSPMRKDFTRRDSQDRILANMQNHEDRIVQQTYKTYSLAFEKLIEKKHESIQSGEKKFNESVIDPKSNGLSNVIKVIDMFKMESALLRDKQSKSHLIENMALKLQPEMESIFQKKRDCQVLSQPIVKQRKQSSQLIQGLPIQQESNFPDDINSAQNSEEASETSQMENRRITKDIRLLIMDRKTLQEKVETLTKSRQDMRYWLQNMQAQTQMMLSLLKDLMNQAQLANNTFTMVNGFFDLRKIIKRCIRSMDAHSSTKKVQILGPIFASPLEKYYFKHVFSDERRYAQIIFNFLSNGIKFTPANGIMKIQLSVIDVQDLEDKSKDSKNSQLDQPNNMNAEGSCKFSSGSAPDKELNHHKESSDDQKSSQQDQSLCDYEVKLVNFQIVFSDSGCGISQEQRLKLFRNFSKLQETQDKNKAGVGLGLSICKDIINAYGGTIDIQSTLGQGTDFIISMHAKCKIDNIAMAEAKSRIEREGHLSSSSESSQTHTYNSQSHHTVSQSLLSSSASDAPGGLGSIAESDDDYSQDTPDKENYRFESDSNKKANKQSFGLNPAQQHLQNQDFEQEHDRSLFQTPGVESEQDSAVANDIDMRRCLLANDSPFLLLAFEDRLKDHFDSVETFENGLQAVEAVKAQKIDYYQAIVLDIQMPIMNGIEACIEIKKFFSEMNEQSQNEKVLVIENGQRSDLYSSQENQDRSEQPIAPFVYALTSEAEPEVILKIQKAGFKRIFHQLDQDVLSQILENCGREPLVQRNQIQEREKQKRQLQELDQISAMNLSRDDLDDSVSDDVSPKMSQEISNRS